MASSSKASGTMLVPPANFAMVEEGVYRSAYPTEANVPYLRHIGIRNVVLLSIEALPGPVKRSLSADVSFKPAAGYATRGPIRVINVSEMCSWRVDGMNSGDDFSRRDVMRALDFAVDRQWHPVLFSCPLGEMQTNVLVGCMRRYQHWSLASIFSECELFTSVCRSLRSSFLFLIEAWDPVAFPMSAVNIQYRNREMHLRDRSRAHQERRRHRRVTTAAVLTNQRQPNLTDSADDHEGDEEEEEEEDDEVGDAHGRASELIDKVDDTDPRRSNVTLSPGKTFNNTSATRTPPSMELKSSNPEAAFISTSGQRPPMTMRRAIAQRLRDRHQQQEQQQQQDSSQQSQNPQNRGGNDGSEVGAALRIVTDCRDGGVQWAEWYLEAMRVGEELKAHMLKSPSASKSSVLMTLGEALPPPHVRYAGVRNPPALDSRSKFTKESIVEEDDD